jgi:hypothetical protein
MRRKSEAAILQIGLPCGLYKDGCILTVRLHKGGKNEKEFNLQGQSQRLGRSLSMGIVSIFLSMKEE